MVAEKTSLFHNWNEYGAGDSKIVKKLYAEATKEILDKFGGFPTVNLAELPDFRTSKSDILRRIPKKHELQMVPELPDNLKVVATGASYNSTKINSKFLEK